MQCVCLTDLRHCQVSETLLHIAATNARVPMLRRLLDLGSSAALLMIQDSEEHTPVSRAVMSGSVECLGMLCKAGADILASVTPMHGTALHLAAGDGHAAMLEHLLKLDCFKGLIDAHDQHGNTALKMAARSGSASCLQSLLLAGADPHARYGRDETIMFTAAEHTHEDMLAFLLSLDGSRAIVNVPDIDGKTPLMGAAIGNSIECTRLLVDAGADPNFADRLGRSPIYYAAKSYRPDLLQVLLQTGKVNLNSRYDAENHCTPLFIAIKYGCLRSVKLLVRAGANLSLTDRVFLSFDSQLSCSSRAHHSNPFSLV
eukprot:m.689104 g.689104  ORF g.689104 m.689104 type:complete len:315 (+) comp58634_c0_seq67:687-1631(+)